MFVVLIKTKTKINVDTIHIDFIGLFTSGILPEITYKFNVFPICMISVNCSSQANAGLRAHVRAGSFYQNIIIQFLHTSIDTMGRLIPSLTYERITHAIQSHIQVLLETNL